jgi:outer membrane beta-barrel protein
VIDFELFRESLESKLLNTNKKNNAHDSVKAVNGIIPFTRKLLSSTLVYGVWSPFYGKVNTFNNIYYFDWYLAAGIGSAKFESNLDSVTDPNVPDSFKTENYTVVGLKTGIKAYISKQFHIGIEFVNQNYEARTPAKLGNKVYKQSNDITLSIGVAFK